MFMEVKSILETNVSQMLKSSIGSTRTFEVNDITDITGDGSESLVQGEVRLTRTDRGILVTGRFSTSVDVVCSRCLEPFYLPLTFDIEEEYFPSIDIVSGNPVEMLGEPGSFTIDEDHVLDLTEAVRQYALTAIPIKTLCRTECAGLCPECGQNLNLGRCSCVRPEMDPRWATLIEIIHTRHAREDQRKGVEK